MRGTGMDTRHWNGPSHGRGGILDLKKEQNERDRVIAARARQRAIGRELRRMYDDVVQEPIPQDILDLLHKLDEADQNKGKKPT